MTTIIAVKRDGVVVMGGDGQVTLGSSVLKHGAKKVRKIYNRSVCWWALQVLPPMVLP